MALLGTDTVIRGLNNLTLNAYESATGNKVTENSTFKKEDLPKSMDDMPNYLIQEFNAIIKYVVVLRGMSGELLR